MNKAVLAGLVLIAAVVVGGGVGFLVLGGKDSNNDSSSESSSSSVFFQSSSTTANSSSADSANDGESQLTKEFVATKNTKSDCYTIVESKVYKIPASFISAHEGGETEILQVCGIDATSAFSNQHGGERKPMSELNKYYVGDLVE